MSGAIAPFPFMSSWLVLKQSEVYNIVLHCFLDAMTVKWLSDEQS
jgi:hypothetical protein